MTIPPRPGDRTLSDANRSGGAGAARRLIVFIPALALALAYTALPGRAFGDAPVKSLLEMRQQNVIVQKFDLSCGAAALATLLNFQFGDHVTEAQINLALIRRREYIEHPELVRVRQGFSLLDLKRYVDSRGYEGVGYGQLELDDLIKLAPIIVAVSPIGYNHFVVFRGIFHDEVLLADPAYGNRTMPTEKFNRIWLDFPELGKVGFVVTRDGHPAPPGLLAPKADEFVTLLGNKP